MSEYHRFYPGKEYGHQVYCECGRPAIGTSVFCQKCKDRIVKENNKKLEKSKYKVKEMF